MNKSINNISGETFEKYGYVIEHQAEKYEDFQVIVEEHNEVGWRVALSKLTSQGIKKLARHPNTMETFTPIQGVTLICVAPPEAPDQYEVFLLDKSVCVNKNVWHAVFCLSESSLLYICENLNVEGEEHILKEEIKVGVV